MWACIVLGQIWGSRTESSISLNIYNGRLDGLLEKPFTNDSLTFKIANYLLAFGDGLLECEIVAALYKLLC